MKVIVAIIAIAGIELFAIHKGQDGYLMTITITAIAGLGGFALKDVINNGHQKLEDIHKACSKPEDQDKRAKNGADLSGK